MMKKLLYFFLPLLAFVACEDNGGDGLKNKSPLSTLTSVSNFNPNGEAAVVETSSDGASVTLKYEVIPASCATVLSEQWENYVTLQALYSNSEEIDFVEMPISEVVADEDNGIITVTASGENLSTEFYSGLIEASCRFIISDNNKEVRSDYRKLTCSRWSAETLPSPQSNEIYYTASGVVSSKMNDVVSNVYDYTKGYYIMTFQNPISEIGDYAFNHCRSLTSITIPDSVTTIGSGAFYYCSSLTSITIPDSVKTIGEDAFDGCSSLKSVNITDIAAWCSISFDSNPLYYAHNLYLNGKLVTDLVIPDGVTKIRASAFNGCSRLISVTIPDSVTNIGNSAFRGCSRLVCITIPDSVTYIGDGAFEGCSGELIINSKIVQKNYDTTPAHWLAGSKFTTVIIGNSVTTIGSSAFSNCSSLTSVTIGDSVTTIGSSAFSNCSSLTSITIPDSVTNIGISAFSGCSSLKSITIPDGVDKLFYKTFSGCTELHNVVISDSVTEIGSYAFLNCRSLTTITIPNGVTVIWGSAFEGCALQEVYCKPIIVPVARPEYNFAYERYEIWKAFGTAKIYVPMESVEAYKSAEGWKNCAEYIFGYDFNE